MTVNKADASGSVSKSTNKSILPTVPGNLHCRFLQQQQIQALKKNSFHESPVLPNKESHMVFFGGWKTFKFAVERPYFDFQP